jgi:hypothetical protein
VIARSRFVSGHAAIFPKEASHDRLVSCFGGIGTVNGTMNVRTAADGVAAGCTLDAAPTLIGMIADTASAIRAREMERRVRAFKGSLFPR